MPALEVCTTQQAAQILGISVTSVQQLVEAGVLQAWKTKGGHRRIPLAAVNLYRGTSSEGAYRATTPVVKGGTTSVILVVEDNAMQRKVMEQKILSWNLPVNLLFCENGYQALVEIATHRPDIVLTDIMMEGMDGYEVVTTILGYPNLSNMHIAILSSQTLEEIDARGGVPDGVLFFQKPINYDELRGYLRACCAHKIRSAAR